MSAPGAAPAPAGGVAALVASAAASAAATGVAKPTDPLHASGSVDAAVPPLARVWDALGVDPARRPQLLREADGWDDLCPGALAAAGDGDAQVPAPVVLATLDVATVRRGLTPTAASALAAAERYHGAGEFEAALRAYATVLREWGASQRSATPAERGTSATGARSLGVAATPMARGASALASPPPRAGGSAVVVGVPSVDPAVHACVRAFLFVRMASVHESRGDTAAALAPLLSALDAMGEGTSPSGWSVEGHPLWATAMARLGATLLELGHAKLAAQCLGRALRTRSAAPSLGPQHPATAVVANNLGVCLWAGGLLQEALAVLVGAFNALGAALGSADVLVASARANVTRVRSHAATLSQLFGRGAGVGAGVGGTPAKALVATHSLEERNRWAVGGAWTVAGEYARPLVDPFAKAKGKGKAKAKAKK
jgi:tetratricopeptide (TPR) repeat protein